MTQDHEPGHASIRAALDAAADAIALPDRERLRRARQRALAGRAAAVPCRRALPLWPASALATAALLLVMLRGNLAHLPGSGETALDAELIGSATELELLEDLEFYEWLDADGAAG